MSSSRDHGNSLQSLYSTGVWMWYPHYIMMISIVLINVQGYANVFLLFFKECALGPRQWEDHGTLRQFYVFVEWTAKDAAGSIGV